MTRVYEKNTEAEMNLTVVMKDGGARQSPQAYTKGLKVFPLVSPNEDPCETIRRNLFQLEKDLAYFNFAITEIKDITKVLSG